MRSRTIRSWTCPLPRFKSVFRSGSSDRSSIWQCPRLACAGLAHRRAPSSRECFAEVHGVVSSTVVDLVLLPPGTGRTQVLTPLDGHYPFFMLHIRWYYFRCENSRQSILDACTCLEFCEHAQARRVFLSCHGSASLCSLPNVTLSAPNRRAFKVSRRHV